MNVGIALNMLTKAGRSDASVLHEHMALGDLAEPLGFDSLFALEHHFTGYAMSPAPTQLLAYYAGRTRRLKLGTESPPLPPGDTGAVAVWTAYRRSKSVLTSITNPSTPVRSGRFTCPGPSPLTGNPPTGVVGVRAAGETSENGVDVAPEPPGVLVAPGGVSVAVGLPGVAV